MDNVTIKHKTEKMSAFYQQALLFAKEGNREMVEANFAWAKEQYNEMMIDIYQTLNANR